jgi:putative ABC transport system ATP-binding protein
VSLTVHAGEVVCVLGPSGSGKTTLLNLLGGLDQPTSGRVVVDGHDLSMMRDSDVTDLRRRNIGFVFQFFELLPGLSAWENVAVPGLLDGVRMKELRARANGLLDLVGMADRALQLSSELSGGELQRVAVARAVMLDPRLVIADEPSGNLDTRNGDIVLQLLADLAQHDRAVVVATHDQRVTQWATRTVELADGARVASTRSEPLI